MKQLLMKFVNILLIVCVLVQYQQNAVVRSEQIQEHNEQLAQAAALEAEYKALTEQAEKIESPYLDGSFQGTGTGFGGDVVVEVTLSDGRIKSVEMISAKGEDSAYLSQAEGLLTMIVVEQSTAVDTVTGATYSSLGILEGVEAALKEAEK